MNSRRLNASGFTLIEVITVLIIIGALSVASIPVLDNILSPSSDAIRQSTLSALRQARSTAYAHRRLVCVSISGASITQTQALSNPTTSCSGTTLTAPDGKTNFIQNLPGASLTASPSSIIYFQSDGRVTSDLAGTTPTDYTVTATVPGQPSVNVTLSGATGSAQ